MPVQHPAVAHGDRRHADHPVTRRRRHTADRLHASGSESRVLLPLRPEARGAGGAFPVRLAGQGDRCPQPRAWQSTLRRAADGNTVVRQRAIRRRRFSGVSCAWMRCCASCDSGAATRNPGFWRFPAPSFGTQGSRTGEVVGGLRAHCPLTVSSTTSTIRVRVEASSVVRLGIVERAQVQRYRAADPTASIPPAPALAGWDGVHLGWSVSPPLTALRALAASVMRRGGARRGRAATARPPHAELREPTDGPIGREAGIGRTKKTGAVCPTRCPTKPREQRKPR